MTKFRVKLVNIRPTEKGLACPIFKIWLFERFA